MLFGLALLALFSVSCRSIAGPKGWASPLVSDDALLVSHRDELFSLSSDGLRPNWAFPAEGSDIDVEALYGTPSLLDDTLYVPGYDGKLYALEIETGRPVWVEAFDAGDSLIGGVAASGDALYFGSDDGKVYSLEASTGRPRWATPFQASKGIWSSPTIAGDVLYVTSLDGSLYALDAVTGAELWSFGTEAGIAAPAVADGASGYVFIGGFDSRLRAIDPDTKAEVWSVKADNWFWTDALIAGGVIYAGSLDGKVYAHATNDGSERWQQPFDTGDAVRAAPLLVGSTLIVVDTSGVVHAIDIEDGTAILSPLDLEADVFADPVLFTQAFSEGGTADEIVVVTTKGELVRIDPETLAIIARVPLT